jgi:hypothetical protein
MNSIGIIKEAFRVKKERNWEKVYFMFDIHGTIFVPSYHREETFEFYPYAQEALELITNDSEIVNILWTCTSDENVRKYYDYLKSCNINFDYINENPEIVNTKLSCFEKKMYCSAGFDDKFGFDPLTDWLDIYNFFHNRSIGKTF